MCEKSGPTQVRILRSDSVVPVSELTHSSSSTSQPLSRPIWSTSSPVTDRPASSSYMDTVRGGYAAAGISAETAQLLLSGWSKGTNTTYQSAWKKWVGWCISREIDPLSCPVQPFLDFLTGLHSEGLKYQTINTIRSAVSMTHNQIEGTPLGQHPWVSRLFRSMYNFSPPQPRYVSTWDVDVMI